jgi:uncharacterized protein YdcH (DUF465 family)
MEATLFLGLLALLAVVLTAVFKKTDEEREFKYLNRKFRRERIKDTKPDYKRYQKLVDNHNVLLKKIADTKKRIAELQNEKNNAET